MTETKEYGVLYAKVCVPKENKIHWLGHCALFNILPKDLQKEIETLTNNINQKYKDSIIIPMDKRIMPGITTKPEVIEKVAQDIFDGMNLMIEKLTGDTNCIRIVYGVGEFPIIIEKSPSTHQIGSYPLMIKIGTSLDKEWEPGIFKVE